MTLDERLDQIFLARDRDHMQPTLDALQAVYAERPENARVLYELGGAYDTAGDGETARAFYERAIDAGLDGDILRRCYLQYGSTLRNLGELERSAEVFAGARLEFPESAALATFEAITLHAAGRHDEAIASLLEAVADHAHSDDIDRYKPAIRGNAAYIRSLQE